MKIAIHVMLSAQPHSASHSALRARLLPLRVNKDWRSGEPYEPYASWRIKVPATDKVGKTRSHQSGSGTTLRRAVNSGRRSRCGLRLMLEREKGGSRLDTSLRQTQMGVGDMTIVDAVFGGPNDLCPSSAHSVRQTLAAADDVHMIMVG